MGNSDLKLFVDAQFTSPYALSAFVALQEKGLPHDLVCIDLATQENRQTPYQQRALTGRVPTLEHGDFALSESSAITEYLEEIFPPPTYATIYPQNPRDRARARQVQAWLRSDLIPIRDERPTTVIFHQPSDLPLSDGARVAVETLFQAAGTLLQDHRLSLFGQWCIADTDLALMLNRLVANGDRVPDPLVEYVQHQWQRSSVQAWLEQSKAV
ncbi:glutathione transferase [Phormidium tenue]|uniref:Glutathione S-transferase n=1 Tax=Phormidium tenue NIES-30 TaxID=549789 RepID=A0A1U7J8L8_9CYAN|nr:glutathione transferase [Phormidium tenue]MBD2231381.1 glutathione transferase [Phormidium tenue FACHB-1052]OKH49611.1 glutathione S-transferase [Phormidium tenue NIES-30]